MIPVIGATAYLYTSGSRIRTILAVTVLETLCDLAFTFTFTFVRVEVLMEAGLPVGSQIVRHGALLVVSAMTAQREEVGTRQGLRAGYPQVNIAPASRSHPPLAERLRDHDALRRVGGHDPRHARDPRGMDRRLGAAGPRAGHLSSDHVLPAGGRVRGHAGRRGAMHESQALLLARLLGRRVAVPRREFPVCGLRKRHPARDDVAAGRHVRVLGHGAWRRIAASGSGLRDMPRGWLHAEALETLDLSGSGDFEGLPLATCVLPQLKSLELDGTRAALRLSWSGELALSGSEKDAENAAARLSDLGLSSACVRGLGKLKRLDLSSNGIRNGSRVESLVAGLPRLESVDLRNNELGAIRDEELRALRDVVYRGGAAPWISPAIPSRASSSASSAPGGLRLAVQPGVGGRARRGAGERRNGPDAARLPGARASVGVPRNLTKATCRSTFCRDSVPECFAG